MSLKLIFFGTPRFAVPCLATLLESEHEVVGVVTQPDRPSGRGRGVHPPPVKELALEHGLDVLQPRRVRTEAFADELSALGADLGVVVAYGRILPPRVLELPRLGHLNVHASLLPRHRGAAPIQHAILAGDAVTGVSMMMLTEGLDEGPVLLRREIPIGEDDTSATLAPKLAELGAATLPEALALLESGEARPVEQDDALATYAPPLERADGRLDWSQPAPALARRVRAVQPWPGAFAHLGDALLKVHGAKPEASSRSDAPGTIVELGDDGPLVACGDGALRLLELQREGKRRTSGAEFARGARLQVGDRLA